MGARPAAAERLRHLLALAVVAAALVATQPAKLFYDFTTYHVAGLLLLEGAPEKAYDAEALDERFQREHHLPHLAPGVFLYSPLYLLPAALAAQVDYPSAVLANQMVTLLSLLGLLYLLLRHAEGWALEASIAAAFLLAQPVGIQFLYQNWSFLLALLVALAWSEGRAGRIGVAAVLWALAIHLKLFAICFLVPLALTGQRRLVALVAVAVVVFAALALPWVGTSSYVAYGEALVELASSGVQPFHNKVSLPAAAARAVTRPWEWLNAPPSVRHPVVRALPWLGLALWLPLVYALRRDPAAALFSTVPFVLLFVPQIWDHSQLLLFVLFLCPALPRRSLFLLAAVLAASVAYGPAERQLMLAALAGSGSAATAFTAQLFYPAVNLLALAMLWGARRGHSSPAAS